MCEIDYSSLPVIKTFWADRHIFQLVINTKDDNVYCINNWGELVLIFTNNNEVYDYDEDKFIGRMFLKNSGWCFGKTYDNTTTCFYQNLYELEEVVAKNFINGELK